MIVKLFDRRRFMVLAAACGLALTLSGCFSSELRDEWPAFTYNTATPVTVDAMRLDIVDVYRPPMGAPHVDHLFKITPSRAAQGLARHQIIPSGDGRVLRMIVDDASVRRSTLPPKEGVVGLFSSEPEEKFDARVALRFELVDELAPDIIRGRASVVATRERTLKGNATLAEREVAYHAIVQALVDDLAQGIGTTVGGTFGKQ